MNDLSFLQVQSARLRRLLIEAGDDPILVPQWKARLQSVEEELRDLTQPEGTLFPKASTVLPRVALYLKGGGVQDSEGIRPSLAGESLIQYERMFTEQAIHDERVAARQAGRQRRRRGAPYPALLFTGTPRGSFGLEFVPQATEDEALLEVHARALTHIADALARIAEDEAPFEDAVAGISPRVLPAMKKFLSVLAQNGAEVRIAFSGAPARVIGVQQIARAVERLDHEWLAEDITVRGIFRGLTWDSNVFDLNADDMGVITGTLADTLTEEDFERIAALTNKRCLADLQKTTLRPVGGVSRDTYLLLDAKPEE